MIKFKELLSLTTEADRLSSQPSMNKAEERRFNFLLSAISVVRAGGSLQDIQNDIMSDGVEKRTGTEDEQRVESFRKFVKETRDGGVGAYTPGHYAGLGYFVPTEFIGDAVAMAQKAGDAILNPDNVTYIVSKSGAPLVYPTINDTSENQSAIGENAQGFADDLKYPNEIGLGAISYRSTYKVSIEAFNDVESAGSVLNLWKLWLSRRIARGVSHDMMVGGQTAPIIGLVDQLSNAGATVIVAQGSAEITGGAETGATSIGNTDIASLIWNLDENYRQSPKCAFWMSDLTLLKLAQLLNKYGNPIIHWQGTAAFLYGYPVRICPSMATPAASATPILFGDGEFVAVREVRDALTNVQVLKEAYIDAGQYGLRTTVRFDAKLLYNGQGKSPFTVLVNHS